MSLPQITAVLFKRYLETLILSTSHDIIVIREGSISLPTFSAPRGRSRHCLFLTHRWKIKKMLLNELKSAIRHLKQRNSTFRVLATALDLHFYFHLRAFPRDRQASTGTSRLPIGMLGLHAPVWMRRWFFRFPAVVNCLPQLDSGHTKGFSPLWVLMCTFSLCST